jgi:predicted amidohydrolase
LDASKWQQWSQRPATSPKSYALEGVLVTAATGHRGVYGGWWSEYDVSDAHDYTVTVDFDVDNLVHDEENVAVTLEWSDATGRPVAVDYLDGLHPTGGKSRRLRRSVRTHSGAARLRVCLIMRNTPRGRIVWKSVEVQPIAKMPSRHVRLATTRIAPAPDPTIERNVRQMEDVIDEAAQHQPDLICLTENFVDRGVPGDYASNSQPIPGEVVSRLAAKAAQHKTYLVTSLHEVEGEHFYNTAVLINRSGRLVGKYRKVHLTYMEQQKGLTPGDSFPVFETDFGRLGIAVCWDLWFPESARILALNGAEVIAFPLAGSGLPGHYEHTWPTRAMDNGVVIVASSTGTSPSQVLDKTGEILATTMGDPKTVCAEVDLDRYFGMRNLSVGARRGEATVLFKKERRWSTYGDLVKPEGMRTSRIIRDPDL